jgi:SAM-dependent methyltransferase
MSALRGLLIALQDLLRALAYRVFFPRAIRRRAQRIAGFVAEHIGPGERVLDIGSGIGTTGKEIEERSQARCFYLDRRRLWLHPYPSPSVICDAHDLAFSRKVFDSVLIVTVLHHCEDPARVLAEARRVSRGKVIVVEDRYTTTLGRYRTILKDALLNIEVWGHPRRFMREGEWESLFASVGLRPTAKRLFDFRMLLVMRAAHVLYVLEPARQQASPPLPTCASRQTDTTAACSQPTGNT